MSDQEIKPFEGKSCTCGVGPWKGATGGYEGGRCENCGGTSIWGVGFGPPVANPGTLPFGLTGHPHDLPVPEPDPDVYEEGAVFSRRMEERIREIACAEATKVIERLIDFAERQDRRRA